MAAESLRTAPGGIRGAGSGLGHLPLSHTHALLSHQQSPGSRQYTDPWSGTVINKINTNIPKKIVSNAPSTVDKKKHFTTINRKFKKRWNLQNVYRMTAGLE
jgi:hypothetical protein